MKQPWWGQIGQEAELWMDVCAPAVGGSRERG